jgi:uncharacterized membrane protein
MDPYLLARLLHIASAMLLFGTGLGTAFHMYVACHSGDVPGIARVARQVVQADRLITTPTAVIQPVTGLWLVHLAGYDFAAPWLVLTYILYALAGAAWLVVLALQHDMHRMAELAARAGTGLPEAFHRCFRLWVQLGWVGFVSLAVVIMLMVTKPDLPALSLF